MIQNSDENTLNYFFSFTHIFKIFYHQSYGEGWIRRYICDYFALRIQKMRFSRKIESLHKSTSFWFSAFFRSKFWLEHGFFSKNTFWVQNKFRSKFFNGKVVIFQIFFNFAEFYGFFSSVPYFWFKFKQLKLNKRYMIKWNG